jgi:nicotinic acid mononucleotide adenylyltransferase
MDRYMVAGLYDKIVDSLTGRQDYFNSSEIAVIIKHIEKPCFFRSVSRITENHDFSCQRVLELSLDILNELAGGRTPEDWLENIYQYVLAKPFPHAANPDRNIPEAAYNAYLTILREVCEFQKLSDDGTWQSRYPLTFLSPDQIRKLENPSEYMQFVRAFVNEYIYEMMKLNQELHGHNTLDHVCGVHYLSMFIALQLQDYGIPVDLGRVSGAAAGHDIGKFGCKGSELKRVPYLHYYYTDQWFRKHHMMYIRNIALNHSTWDLEIENLPLESLLIIYSDFRVKKDHQGNMRMFDLDKSFDIVLQKLDNLDQTKVKRYSRVFAKLKDFEDYLLQLGIKVNPGQREEPPSPPAATKNRYSLMHGKDIVQSYKYLAINHNINLMYRLRDEASLNAILETARSQKYWKNLREYLRIFEEYSTHLTQKQKLITIRFLYENLIHPEDDIRRHCSELIGTLIATFDEDYRKEVPEDMGLQAPDITSFQLFERYVEAFLSPDHKIIPTHRVWIGNCLGIMISSLFDSCKKKTMHRYARILAEYCKQSLMTDDSHMMLYLLKTVKYIPITCDEGVMDELLAFITKMAAHIDEGLRLPALDAVSAVLSQLDRHCASLKGIEALLCERIEYSPLPAENFLKYKIASALNLSSNAVEKYHSFTIKDIGKTSEIYLSNLKTAADSTAKKIQVELLLTHALNADSMNSLYTAMHFCNLIKVSSVEDVRITAGKALVALIPRLSLEQRNDIAIELLRALEIEGSQFTKYIPYYLGQIILFLRPVELDEILDDLGQKIKGSGPQINSLLLKTLGVALSYYPGYKDRFPDNGTSFNTRMIKMLGILLNGLVSYDHETRQTAFSVLGKDLFGSKYLSLEDKKQLFTLTAKKMLTLLPDAMDNELMFLSNASGLCRIYSFISDYIFSNGEIELKYPSKVAFFPGTFDPFSSGHKEIAREIAALGFEVYLAIDEFSWSKRTQPHIIRRNIINMSVADQLSIFLYPEDMPVNIANADDLDSLRRSFPRSSVYIVVGSDVVLNASGYRDKNTGNSVHSFPHIIFDRRSALSSPGDDARLDDGIEKIGKEVVRLSLPPQYEDISSTQIRDYIDQDRDISMLVDPLAQKYIYANGLYRREPQYKTLIKPTAFETEVQHQPTAELLEQLSRQFFGPCERAAQSLKGLLQKLNPRLILLRDLDRGGKVIGFSAFHWVRLNMLFGEFKDNTVSEYIRERAVGRILVMDGIFVERNVQVYNIEQILLTETLSYCLAKDYSFAVFRNTVDGYSSPSLYDLLELHGFERFNAGQRSSTVYTVNMSRPCTLYLDGDNTIKEPYRSSALVKRAIEKARKKLQRALTMLYPGNLVLSFDMDMLHQTLIRKIKHQNQSMVSDDSNGSTREAMCVPFGILLNNQIVPNTVTKSLHTEKLFAPDMRSFSIGPFPYYLNLNEQVRILSSFGRPVILVDDLLHKGYRIKALDPIFKREGLEIRKIIVGLLSARGKELMDIQRRSVDSAYFIPRLKAWFHESLMYPFIGGDTLWRGDYPQWNLIPSVNLILPYTSPTFISDVPNSSLYNLSQTCLENAFEIMTALEEEYQILHERSLTLDRLGEVVKPARCPDHGNNIYYDLNLSPSLYLLNDLELLRRLENTIIKQ